MSKAKARRRAEDRAKRAVPRSKAERSTTEQVVQRKREPHRSARAERQRRRVIVMAVLWVLANAAVWLLTDTWNSRWLGLTVTTIAVPLLVWLIWDPEGRVNL